MCPGQATAAAAAAEPQQQQQQQQHPQLRIHAQKFLPSASLHPATISKSGGVAMGYQKRHELRQAQEGGLLAAKTQALPPPAQIVGESPSPLLPPAVTSTAAARTDSLSGSGPVQSLPAPVFSPGLSSAAPSAPASGAAAPHTQTFSSSSYPQHQHQHQQQHSQKPILHQQSSHLDGSTASFLELYKSKCGLASINPQPEVLAQLAFDRVGTRTALSLHLANLSLELKDVSVLCQCLAQCSTVSLLSLGGNHLGDVGAMEIAALVERSASLESLGLDDCHIGDAGGVAIAKALASSASPAANAGRRSSGSGPGAGAALTLLDLSNNRLGNDAAIAFGAAFRSSSTSATGHANAHGSGCRLQTLVLSNNRIADKGGVTLVESLRVGHASSSGGGHCFLQKLSLVRNPIGFKTGAAIVETLKRNTWITVIDISHTNIPRSQVEAITLLLQENLKRRVYLNSPNGHVGPLLTSPQQQQQEQQEQQNLAPTAGSRMRPMDENLAGSGASGSSSPMLPTSMGQVSPGLSSSTSNNNQSPVGLASNGINANGSPSSAVKMHHADLVHKCREIIESSTTEAGEKISHLVALFHQSVQRMTEYNTALAIANEKLHHSRTTVQALGDRLRQVGNERARIESSYKARLDELDNAQRNFDELKQAYEQTALDLASSRQSEAMLRRELEGLRETPKYVEELSGMLEQSNKELRRISEMWSVQEQEKRALETALEASSNELDSLLVRMQEMQLLIDVRTAELDETRDDAKKLAFALDDSHKELVALKAEVTYAAAATETSSQLQSWRRRETELEDEIAALRRQRDVSDRRVGELELQMKELQAAATLSLEEEKERKRKDLAAAKSPAMDLEDALRTAMLEIEQSNQALLASQEEVRRLRATVASLQGKQQQQSERDGSVATLREQQRQMQEELVQKRVQLAKMQEEEEAAGGDLAAAKEKISTLETFLKSNESTAEHLKRKVKELQEELLGRDRTAQRMGFELKELQGKVESLSQRLGELQREKETLVQQVLEKSALVEKQQHELEECLLLLAEMDLKVNRQQQ